MSKLPCKVGDQVFRVGNLCEQECEFETEVCQQRTCRHFFQEIYPEKVTKVECIPNGPEEGIFIHTNGSSRHCLLGEVVFLTKKEAEDFMKNNWRSNG